MASFAIYLRNSPFLYKEYRNLGSHSIIHGFFFFCANLRVTLKKYLTSNQIYPKGNLV